MNPRFLAVLLMCILAGTEVDLFIPSFPEIQEVFNLSPFLVQLTLSSNFIAYCLCCLFTGALGDKYNRRHVLNISLVIFIIGSLFSALALNFPLLIIGRILQGIGVAAPSILSYLIIADDYSVEKQHQILGILNGIVTLAMAFAPVLGSYVNLYFNWRGNFFVLLILGFCCFLLGFFVIPSTKGDPSVSLSVKAYVPLIKSKNLMVYIFSIVLFSASYWLFISMAPILYMNDLGVSLKNFGFYQGALACAFSISSILSSRILKIFGTANCLKWGTIFCFLCNFLTASLAIFNVTNPLVITCVLSILSMIVVFPINILYPIALDILPKTKSRSAALINALRLITTSIAIEVVSYIYQGSFYPIGITMAGLTFLSVALIWFFIINQPKFAIEQA